MERTLVRAARIGKVCKRERGLEVVGYEREMGQQMDVDETDEMLASRT